MPRTLLVGAEGCSEAADCSWLREATKDEIAKAIEMDWDNNFGFANRYLKDGTGRPYFWMTITDEAPKEILESAATKLRVVRLFN